MYNVRHISRCHTSKSFVCKQKNFEVYAVNDRQPVEVKQDWGDVIPFF